jgi:hypothetical protein
MGMGLVLGVDPGRKNLALCLIRPGQDPLGTHDEIVKWEVLSLEPTARGLVRCMTTVAGWTDWTDVTVAIERQPAKNPTMKRLENYLEMHFATLGAKVCAIDPKHKLAYAARTAWWPRRDIDAWTYHERKKLAVETVSAMLRDSTCAPGRAADVTAGFWATKKKDDFADSMLHAMAFAHVVGPVRVDTSARVRKIKPVEPSDAHVRTGKYSQAGLKFLARGHLANVDAFVAGTTGIRGFDESCTRHFGNVAAAYVQLT